ncbi:alkane 1-monooxygenase [Alphaproteobacteria bacterium]|nr:alkane 1-monooxygenase [Alphaproteobacteria bacterium]
MLRVFLYFISFSLPISVIIGLHVGGVFTFFTVFLGYVILPVFDLLIGRDEKRGLQENSIKFAPVLKIISWLALPVQIGVLLYCFWHISYYKLSAIEYVGLIISAGISSGAFGITVAHELIHQRYFERILSRLILFTVCYPHFCIEHVHGHHINVGTPKDPASARIGQNVYNFLFVSIFGSFTSAWKIETKRIERKKLKKISFSNIMIQNILVIILLFFTINYFLGFLCLLFFILQSMIAIIELEIINYIEHYGLQRKEILPGKFEKQSSKHSWNSNHILSNYSLFNLPLHSDHHKYAGRRYHQLRHDKNSPQLPFGYSFMLILALFPFLWKRVMDPLAKKAME